MRRVNVFDADFRYEPGDPEGFRSGMFRMGPLVGGERVGATVYELPPGQAVCPYHYEYGEEEWLLVLAGRPTVRHPRGSETLGPGDVVCFPRGPQGAHGVRNETEESARVLIFSEVRLPTATVYPDSGKVGIWTGNADDDLVVRRESAVDYFDGEAGT
jgi:uncharacterized cupin superfamily protein